MPRSDNDQPPCAYVAKGEWPHVVLADDAPVSAVYGLDVAVHLAQAIEHHGIGLRRLGEKAGVAHTTIGRVLRGQVLPDIGTMARPEQALDTKLWPW